MSRCFPYPPPGYVRNPVAVAEAESTAKLQKEREKVEKKKEKRSDKKAPRLGETSKHSKHRHKKRKLEDVRTAGQEPKRVSQDSVEQLEKSGLSEEHGAPCFVQTMHHSPESSQDSSKRRKVVLPSPSQAKNGNILRIKIKSNQDSQSALLEKPRVLEQPLVQQMGSGSSLLSKQNSIQQKADVRVSDDFRAVQKCSMTETPSKTMQRVVPKPAVKVDHQLSLKAPVGRSSELPPKCMGSMGPSPARVLGRIDPPPVKMRQRIQHPPSMVSQKVDPLLAKVSQKVDPQLAKVSEKESAVCLPEAPLPPVLQKPKDLTVLQQPITSLPKEEPCFSGRKVEAVQVKDRLSRSDQKKIRKAEKKEKKFRDLFVTWNPILIENEGSDLGDQDWLFSSTRTSDANMAQSRAPDGLGPIHSMVQQQPSLQPRATFLPDLHIYQLPYVVPF